jgi:DNA (cytosine-5)-methyltransferase 1
VKKLRAALKAPRRTVGSQTVGELFCGAGGMGLGLKWAGLRPSWAIDIDADACRTYQRNVGKALCSKVENVAYEKLPTVSGLAFGFPCNDFSFVGERRGTAGYYGGLFKEAMRALNKVKPNWFVAENVPGLMSSGGLDIMREFANCGRGYDVALHLYKFEDYGVPQRRWRIVAVGIAVEEGKRFRVPVPTHSGRAVSSAEALAGVENVTLNNERTRHPARTIDMLSHIPEGENAWHEDVPKHLRIATNCKLSLIYRRLKRDEPAYTVVAAGGGGTHMYHFEEPRALTNRERARLQTFPDDFEFLGGHSSVRKQIGMAVPPMAAKVIGSALLSTLKGTIYPSIEPSLGYLGPADRNISVAS